jgi:hypothetical protein
VSGSAVLDEQPYIFNGSRSKFYEPYDTFPRATDAEREEFNGASSNCAATIEADGDDVAEMGGEWYCSRSLHHPGPHVAMSADLDDDNILVVARWYDEQFTYVIPEEGELM